MPWICFEECRTKKKQKATFWNTETHFVWTCLSFVLFWRLPCTNPAASITYPETISSLLIFFLFWNFFLPPARCSHGVWGSWPSPWWRASTSWLVIMMMASTWTTFYIQPNNAFGHLNMLIMICPVFKIIHGIGSKYDDSDPNQRSPPWCRSPKETRRVLLSVASCNRRRSRNILFSYPSCS